MLDTEAQMKEAEVEMKEELALPPGKEEEKEVELVRPPPFLQAVTWGALLWVP